jgi:hypothetical protein
MRATIHRRRQGRRARFQRRLIRWFLEGKSLLPRDPRVDPRLQQRDLLRRHSLALWRHLLIRVGRENDLDHPTHARLARRQHRAVLTALQQRLPVIEGEAALLLVPRMALRAMLPQDRHDLMGEIEKVSASGKTSGSRLAEPSRSKTPAFFGMVRPCSSMSSRATRPTNIAGDSKRRHSSTAAGMASGFAASCCHSPG